MDDERIYFRCPQCQHFRMLAFGIGTVTWYECQNCGHAVQG